MKKHRHFNLKLIVVLFLTLFSAHVFASFNPVQDHNVNLTEQEQKWLNNHPEITVAFDGYFPPYSFLTDDNKLEGFSVDVFNLIRDMLGINIIPYPEHEWSTLYDAAKKREVDVVATMVNREERAEWFNFTRPYIEKSLVVITQAENDEIDHKDDLANKTLALVKDYQYSKRILVEEPSIKPLYVDTILDALNAVSIGDADAAVAFLGAGHFYRTRYLLSNLKYAAIYDKQGSPESIAIRNDQPHLASILSKALEAIPEAKLQTLLAKWLPVDYINSVVEIELTNEEREWINNHKDIRLGIDPEFAPFEFMDNTRYSGMASDYIRLLNQRLNLNMKVVKGLEWRQVIAKAKQKEIDVLPAVGITEERQSFLNYTQPYLSFHRVIVTQSDAPFIVGLQDLNAMKVAVQANSSHEGYIRENSNLIPVPYKSLKSALLALSGGEADAFVGNVASTTYWIRKLNLTNLKVAAPVSKEVQSLHFAVRKDWPELTAILQKGLDSITDKQRKEISEKWMSVDNRNTTDYSQIIKIIILLSGLIILIFTWNLLLNRKVRRQTKDILHAAQYDQITNLPNRFLIQERLTKRINEARKNRTKIAVLSIDIDEFKKINDAYGHSAGDAILQEVTTRLASSLKEGDTLGRLGGDQFILLLCDFRDLPEAVISAQNIRDSFSSAFRVDDREFILSSSIGISVFPHDGETASELLKNADSATHHAKSKAKGSFEFYTSSIHNKVSRTLEIESQLRNALKNDEFYLVYQPKVDAKKGHIVSFEALLRWHNIKLGDISPVEFIPVAENSNLISAIGSFVIDQALKQLAIWQKEFDQNYMMAINLSPVQFRSRDLITHIEHAIKQSDINPRTLEMEITEGILLGGYSETDYILNSLTNMGIRLAMDDFGTGYSSMSNLRRFNFNTLKIDREFISDLPENLSDGKLVTATIMMAQGLGMKVVAEGVETAEQRDFLIAKNCDILQGYFFGKPMLANQIRELLKSES